MERNVIAVLGIHGSGKSRFAKEAVGQLQLHISIDHLPVGDTIRKIGRGVIESCRSEEIRDHLQSKHADQLLNDEIMYDVMSEAFTAYRGSDTIVIDGYPRTEDQAEQLDMLALVNNCKVAGFIQTDTNDTTAVKRMIKRSPRDYEGALTVTAARARVQDDRKYYQDMALAQNFPNVPLHVLDTTGTKEDTTIAGMKIVRNILHLPNPQ